MSFIKINDFQPNYMQSIAESRVQYFCSCVFETLPDYLYKVEATDWSKNHCTPLLRLWYTHPPPKLLELSTSKSSPWAMRKLPKGSVFIVLLSPVYWSALRNQRIRTMSIPRQAVHVKWTFARFELLPRCLWKPKRLMQLKSWKRPSQRCRATLFPDDSRSTAWSAVFIGLGPTFLRPIGRSTASGPWHMQARPLRIGNGSDSRMSPNSSSSSPMAGNTLGFSPDRP